MSARAMPGVARTASTRHTPQAMLASHDETLLNFVTIVPPTETWFTRRRSAGSFRDLASDSELDDRARGVVRAHRHRAGQIPARFAENL